MRRRALLTTTAAAMTAAAVPAVASSGQMFSRLNNLNSQDPLIELGKWEQLLHDEYCRLAKIETSICQANRKALEVPIVEWQIDRGFTRQFATVPSLEEAIEKYSRPKRLIGPDGSVTLLDHGATKRRQAGQRLLAKLKAKIARSERAWKETGAEAARATSEENAKKWDAIVNEIRALEPRSVEGVLVKLRVIRWRSEDEEDRSQLSPVIAGLERLV